MNQAFFMTNIFGGGTSHLNCRVDNTNHPIFNPLSTPPSNISKSKEYFGIRAVDLLVYKKRIGCTPYFFSSLFSGGVSFPLSLTYKTVCHKLYKGLKKVVSVLTSNIQSVYVMLCYVICYLIIYLSIYLGVLVFKSYGIQHCMLCCRHNIARRGIA